jgi:hypothetical protein
MEELLNKLDGACTQYLNGELDDAGFRAVIDEIPAELWQDKQSAMTIVKALVENEDLYDASVEKWMCFAGFICNLLPRTVREKPDYILGIAEIIADFMGEFDEGLSTGDLDAVFSSAPQTLWEDEHFATAAANLVIDNAYSMYDLNCISEIIPETVWKNDNDLRWVVLSIYNADERNMNQLSLFPKKAWESAETVSLILSCLVDALESDRAWGTAYCNFRNDDESYLDAFLEYVPDKFDSDKDFILDILRYNYFSDSFTPLFDWMDPQLWLDKEFVIEVLEKDCGAVIYVPDALATDEEFRTYIDENIELKWIEREYSQDEIPQWIKDWNM